MPPCAQGNRLRRELQAGEKKKVGRKKHESEWRGNKMVAMLIMIKPNDKKKMAGGNINKINNIESREMVKSRGKVGK